MKLKHDNNGKGKVIRRVSTPQTIGLRSLGSIDDDRGKVPQPCQSAFWYPCMLRIVVDFIETAAVRGTP